jgi:serine/threonine-protein kinase
VAQQLAVPPSSNAVVGGQQPKLTNSSATKIQTNAINFSTYDNPILGIRIQYPHNWLIAEHTFNPAANNTIVSFFSPSKSATALGNVSGVSGNFVPYVDIFVFPSKNMSLPKLVSATIKKFALNNMTVVPNESKPITLRGGTPAYVMTYTVTIASDELFKKMQIWTIKADKVFVITYTAQAALFPNYLPMAQKLVDSFAFIPGTNAPTLATNLHPSVTNNNTLPSSPPRGLLPPLSR